MKTRPQPPNIAEPLDALRNEYLDGKIDAETYRLRKMSMIMEARQAWHNRPRRVDPMVWSLLLTAIILAGAVLYLVYAD